METKLSDSYATLGQALLLIFFTPLNFLIWFIAARSGFDGALFFFAITITALTTFFIFLAFKTADVSIENRTFFIKRLFGSRRIPVDKLKKIGTVLFSRHRRVS